MNKHQYHNKQFGLSMIELLVAMLIGLFLLAGIASSYVSSKKADIGRDQTSLLEDNGRIALETITNIIQHTGYASSSSNGSLVPFVVSPTDVVSFTCPGGSQSVVNPGLFNNANRVVRDRATGDSLAVVYYGDNNLFTDCLGGELPPTCRISSPGGPTGIIPPRASRIFSSFYIAPDNTLRCAGSRNARAHVIAEGVENIQYLYGVDADSDGQVDRYLNATNLAVTRLWQGVISIQVAVLIRSLKPVKSAAESKRYTLLDQSITSDNDKFKREVFTTTVRIRNNF